MHRGPITAGPSHLAPLRLLLHPRVPAAHSPPASSNPPLVSLKGKVRVRGWVGKGDWDQGDCVCMSVRLCIECPMCYVTAGPSYQVRGDVWALVG